MSRTVDYTLGRGPLLSSGSVAGYHAIDTHPGQPLVDVDGAPVGAVGDDEQSVLYLAHVSDLHLTDVESPARLDFFIDAAEDPRHEQVLPVARPQQLTSVHASVAALHSIDQLPASPRSGRDIDVAVFTGDLIDNAQQNEMDLLMSAVSGGTLQPFAEPNKVAGTQTETWNDAQVWRPHDADNLWVRRFGFPHNPGLISAIAAPFLAPTLQTPSYFVRGNHDGLLAGTVAWTPVAEELASGSEKVRGLPAADQLEDPARSFRQSPDDFMSGRRVETTTLANRVPLPAGDFPLVAGSAPAPTRLDGRGSFLADLTGRVRLIVLDTVDDAGHPDGAFTREAMDWLQQALEESTDRLVLLASHHGPFDHHPPAVPQAVGGQQIVDLLLAYENVVGWLCGHTHFARTRLHSREGARGFWEITAPAIIDWPCQFSTVEIFEARDGRVRLDVVLHDLDVPLQRAGESWRDIAALHRELCANQADFGAIFPGRDFLDVRNRSLTLPPR